MRLRFAFALCLFSLSAVLSAETTPHWLKVKAEHFVVLTDGSAAQARHTAAQLERMHDVFAKLIPGAKDDAGSRIVVLAFRDRKGFQAVEPAAYLAKGSLDLAGLFQRGDDRNYILLRLDDSGEHPYSTLYHEYTHYMARHAVNLPLWFNEGLAQFYQNTDIGDRDVRLGQPDGNEILYLRQQKLIPLATLFAIGYDSPYYHEQDKGSVFYGESWALTHMLFTEDFGKPDGRLHAYAVNLTRGESSVVAAEHAFGDLAKLQQGLEGYIQHGDYRLLNMQFKSSVDEKALQVEPVPTADADATRADVLARSGRAKEAETLLQSVLAASPDNAEAHETLGQMRLREGDQAGALKAYDRAVALHSSSFLAYYYAGVLAMRDGPAAPEAAGDNLRKAVELNPGFGPALDALAEFDTQHRDKLDEALQMSLRAVGADPGKMQYRLDAAEVRMARNEIPSAVSALQYAVKVAKTPEDRDQASGRLKRVQDYQQAVEQSDALQAEGQREMAEAASAPPPSGHTAEVRDKTGNVLHTYALITPDHKFPDSPSTGPKHTITGRLAEVGCFYPKGMTLKVQSSSKPVVLYSNDMYTINYTSGNFTPEKELNPCLEFNGLKATITYRSVEDATVSGQIISMELNK